MAPTQRHQDTWFFPKEFSNDLTNIPGLSARMREEVLNTAWEYSRVVIPQFTNWTRFCCYVRLSAIGIIAEYHGDLTDITATSKILGYDVDELLDTMLMNRPGADETKREYRTYLLITSAKSSGRWVSYLPMYPAQQAGKMVPSADLRIIPTQIYQAR